MAKRKTKKAAEGPSPKELMEKVATLNGEIFSLRNELAINRKLDKPHLLRAKRKEKARALTALTQQQRASEVA